jgi:hypothetical protein
MSNGNKPAFPSSVSELNRLEAANAGKPIPAGLTKLEYFAGQAIRGLCLTASPKYDKGECDAAILERAVVLARALLAELEKEKGV